MCLMRLTRTLVAAMVLALVGLPAATYAQRHRATDDIPRYEDYLRKALPGAETFRFVDTGTPHYRGYRQGPNGEETLVGVSGSSLSILPRRSVVTRGKSGC